MGGGGKHYTSPQDFNKEIPIPEPVKNKTIKVKTNKKKRSKKMDKKENNTKDTLVIEYTMTASEIACGDFEKGRKMLKDIAERLEHAHKKHPKEEWQKMDVYEAMKALLDEIDEVRIALKKETPERVQDELLDVIAVAFRILNKEYGD